MFMPGMKGAIGGDEGDGGNSALVQALTEAKAALDSAIVEMTTKKLGAPAEPAAADEKCPTCGKDMVGGECPGCKEGEPDLSGLDLGGE